MVFFLKAIIETKIDSWGLMRVNTEERETEMKTKLQVKVILSVWQPRLREKLHEEIQSLHDPKPHENIRIAQTENK